MADETKQTLFKTTDGIEPMQFFDVDFLESWESSFDLSPNSGAPFGYLLQRARDPLLRHRSIQTGVVNPQRPEAPTPYEQNINESRSFLEKLARAWKQPEPASGPASAGSA